jgi:hypothetical protein
MSNNINNFIREIKQNGKTLNNQCMGEEMGVKGVQSSTFITEKHLLIKGEYEKEKYRKRNAIIIWYDVVKRQVMGKCLSDIGNPDFWIQDNLIPGHAETSNEKQVHSVKQIRIKDHFYLFVSGDSKMLDIFKIKSNPNSVQFGRGFVHVFLGVIQRVSILILFMFLSPFRVILNLLIFSTFKTVLILKELFKSVQFQGYSNCHIQTSQTHIFACQK